MFKSLEEEEYFCFKCGHTPKTLTYNDEELAVCPDCGTSSIVGRIQIIDVINDLIEKGVLNEDISYRRLTPRNPLLY